MERQMDKKAVLALVKEHDAKFIDLRFTNLRGKQQHISIPVSAFNDDLLKNGKIISGSAFQGWQNISQSDLILLPDLSTIKRDPFYEEATLFIHCNILDPRTDLPYTRDPRAVALRAEVYLRSTGIADQALFGPELEFFVFDDVRFQSDMYRVFYSINSEEGHWNSGKAIDGGNTGHRPSVKGGYFSVPPVDSSQDLRSAICLTLEALGIPVEAHHHEIASANQCEVATRFNTLTLKADELQILKYVVHNAAHNYGKTATFMPKPLVGDNGSGMHCHQSLIKQGVNLFAGDGYAGLSEIALYYIGGIMHHARALNVFTNPAINSYKRLVPGFGAPVMLAYSARNRSAAIRIPHTYEPKARHIEVRFPDPLANPYLAFSAMMMAGLDGIQRQLHPGAPIDKDLYDLSSQERLKILTVASSLDEAVASLKEDHAFLLKGGVFTEDLLESAIALRQADIDAMRTLVHPHEFDMYYSG
jgi:glutamine synthetase